MSNKLVEQGHLIEERIEQDHVEKVQKTHYVVAGNLRNDILQKRLEKLPDDLCVMRLIVTENAVTDTWAIEFWVDEDHETSERKFTGGGTSEVQMYKAFIMWVWGVE